MKAQKTLLALSVIAALTLLGGAAARGPLGLQQQEDAPLPALPDEALGVRDILMARPYVLDEPYTHAWRAERPKTAAGFVLVLEVEEPFTVPRDTMESVLYVGDQSAERINWGAGSGRVVALVPTPMGADGAPQLDLSEALVFYGRPALPERVDATWIHEELELAEAQGLQALAAERVEAALAVGGELVSFPGRFALERYAASLVLQHSPAERGLAEGLLVPLIR